MQVPKCDRCGGDVRLKDSVLSILVLALKPLIMEKAKEKQTKAGGPLPKKSAEPPFETRQELAKLAGVSHEPRCKEVKFE